MKIIAPMMLAALAGAAPAAVPAPRIATTSLAALPQPLPLPYDEAAVGAKDVAAARAQAKREGKKVLIDLGGNWCPDCRALAGVMALPDLKPFLAKHFVIVTVDIGRYSKNLDVPAKYGITGKLDGVPAILVVDPRSDRLVNKGRLYALTDARHMTPQALADWLAQWA